MTDKTSKIRLKPNFRTTRVDHGTSPRNIGCLITNTRASVARSRGIHSFKVLKPNYFKKQSSLSSFLPTCNNTGPKWPGVVSKLVSFI